MTIAELATILLMAWAVYHQRIGALHCPQVVSLAWLFSTGALCMLVDSYPQRSSHEYPRAGVEHFVT